MDDAVALRGLHVLLVGEDAERLELFERILQYCGAFVTACSSAGAALRVVERVRADVLVVDVETLFESSVWLVRSIRALAPERGGRMPALALTMPGADHDRLRAEGFQLTLAKPVRGRDLCEAIAALARRDRLA